MKPLFVSFYTPTYEEEANGLRASLDAFGLDHSIVAVPSRGDWIKNCAFKPAFLLRMMGARPGRALVWIDADGRVKKYPVIFNSLDCDFAAHWRNGEELLSGTMYFAPTVAARMLLEKWQVRIQLHPGVWDQRALAEIVDPRPDWLRVTKLPASYTRIFDAPDMCDSADTVIEHRQASRKFRETA